MITCENCAYQTKVWHDDKRCKDGGYFIYGCELNDDPFVSHAVNGHPGEYCSSAKLREKIKDVYVC